MLFFFVTVGLEEKPACASSANMQPDRRGHNADKAVAAAAG